MFTDCGASTKEKRTLRQAVGEKISSPYYRKQVLTKTISFFRLFLILGLAFVILYPILYMVSVSFRAAEDVLDPSVVWIPRHFTLENYKMAGWLLNYGKSLLTTSTMALLCTILQCFTSSLTGYGFARFKFFGKNVLLLGALSTLLVPIQTTMMPLYNGFVQISHITGIPTINTPIPLAISALLGMGLKGGLFIFLFYQFYKGLPTELEDAAYIDGCGPVKTYYKVLLPNAGSMLLVVFLLSLVWYWNDNYQSLLYYPSNSTLSVGLGNMLSRIMSSVKPDGTNYSTAEMMAYLKTGALIVVFPILIVYLLLQRKFTKSVIMSGIVG